MPGIDSTLDTDGPEFSLVVLGYAAGEAVRDFVERQHRALVSTGTEFELVLVANYWPGRDDDTPSVAADLALSYPEIVVVSQPKRGDMGWDMRTGLAACSGDLLGVIDGDGQFPVEVIAECLQRLREPEIDLVKTYRTHRGDGRYRRALSWTYNRLFGLLFAELRGVRDANSKPKLMTRAAYEAMELCADDWFIDAEIMLEAARLDLRMAEIPVAFSALDDRKSFVGPRAVTEFCMNLLRTRLRR